MRRNKTIFEDDFRRPSNPTYTILKIVEVVDNYSHYPLKTHQYGTIFIAWKRPQEGWIKLDCNGACKDSLDLAGCGGLFQNSCGRWYKGYSRKIEKCDVFCVEIWGMY